MHDSNPYAAPSAPLQLHDVEVMADRLTRLGASLIDSAIIWVVMVPLMWFGGYLPAVIESAQRGEQLHIGLILLWIPIGTAVFAAVHWWPLKTGGQTWGKRIVGIQIVTLDGQQVAPLRVILARHLPVRAVSGIPFVGAFLMMINICMIFRQDRRCGHDFVAGTRVVRAR
ncbi:RDD family protein [Luteimonas fraxinea]|uniref:RDD family protein n=1 Tax=Luteimonas fraxinea TaxID=2901869 RepID=A0ABS8UE71_9GAMM|nr:RDD family protein [Luteimonas fraxinea]MCD9097793.1 RDD family protein [Luteimonas fraxinea]MCD9126486.1 RDD family protein [Luteimonas fraxinea]UHH09460.1 RDD family protein [Luteimonas fraxinea]